MLKTMRKKAKIILWILAVVIIPLFIWWGSGPTSRSDKTSQYAGKIYGKKVSWDEFRQNMLQLENRLRLIYGDNYKQVAKLHEKLLTYCENNGYPYASVKLDSIEFSEFSIKAELNLTKNKEFHIDSIIMEGSAKIAPKKKYS